MSREFTNRMIELLDEGMFIKSELIAQLLVFLSEQEVRQFVIQNDFYGFKDLGFESSDYAEIESEMDMYDDNALEEEF